MISSPLSILFYLSYFIPIYLLGLISKSQLMQTIPPAPDYYSNISEMRPSSTKHFTNPKEPEYIRGWDSFEADVADWFVSLPHEYDMLNQPMPVEAPRLIHDEAVTLNPFLFDHMLARVQNCADCSFQPWMAVVGSLGRPDFFAVSNETLLVIELKGFWSLPPDTVPTLVAALDQLIPSARDAVIQIYT